MKRLWRRLAGSRGRPLDTPRTVEDARRLARGQAEGARDAGDWLEAARFYALVLDADQADAPTHVQHAHALKEAGRLPEAEAAYRRALALRPEDAETYLHLAEVLKRRDRVEDAKTVYVDVLTLRPDFTPARDQLIAMGARGRLPHHAYGRDVATEHLAGLGRALAEVRDLAAEWRLAGAFPIQAWDAFRQTYPVAAPPPARTPAPRILVIVAAQDAQPSDIRATLNGLLDQSIADWRAIVVSNEAVLTHPVASVGARDERVRFATTPPAADPSHATLLIDAGTVLSPQALAWFGFASGLTGCDVIHADHDSHSVDWRAGAIFFDPALFGAPDADDLSTNPVVPAAVLLRPGLAADPAWRGAEGRRAALLDGVRRRSAAHLPKVLCSRFTDGPAIDPPAQPVAAIDPSEGEPLRGGILVVVPTRDEAEMLQTCVDSLRRTASRPEALDILILDNRSRQPETRALLDRMAADGRARWRAMDEPFNWARFNNLGCGGAEASILVFANNDVEALSEGWDDRLRRDLARPEVGVVGARLLYPDGSLQHAAVAMGANAGRPVHEGLNSRPGEAGPLSRWTRRRRVSAVTGAFMALRREAFEALGGFDEALAVGYNDIDLCLKARAAGMAVLYDAEIVLMHHESKTRGVNDGGERKRFDDGELTDLHRRWGPALLSDPSVNPQWVSAHSRVFDGYRDLGPQRTIEWLLRSARSDPWRILDEDRVIEGARQGDPQRNRP